MPGRHSLSLMLNINKAVKQKSNARKAQFIVDVEYMQSTMQQKSNARKAQFNVNQLNIYIYIERCRKKIKYQEGTVYG